MIGWCIPLLFTVIWSLVMYFTEKPTLDSNPLFQLGTCWTDTKHEHQQRYQLIIQIPIFLTLMINMYVLISVVKIVGTKLRANSSAIRDYKIRLAKSTLALIPLLGIQYVVTIFFERIDASETYKLTSIKLIPHQAAKTLFSRIPGFLVSIIYCFFNSEILTEIQKQWQAWQTGQELELDALRRRSTISNGQLGMAKKASVSSQNFEGQRLKSPSTHSQHLGFSNAQTSRRSSWVNETGIWFKSLFHPLRKY